MKISIVTPENILDYWSILSSDEVFGINDNRLNCFVISDEDGNSAGKMTARIFPEYIRLESLFIFPEFRHKGFATALLNLLKNRPKEAFLPIRTFLEDEEDIRALLEKSGFTEEKCDYSIFTLSLGDFPDANGLIKRKFPDVSLSKYKLLRMDHVPKQKLRQFILNSPHDELYLFPDKTLDLDRFSDGSIICEKDGQIEAVSLIEETDDYTQFTWTYGKDSLAILICMAAAREDLQAEYGPDYQIRCVCWDETTLKIYQKSFANYELKQIKMYRFAG